MNRVSSGSGGIGFNHSFFPVGSAGESLSSSLAGLLNLGFGLSLGLLCSSKCRYGVLQARSYIPGCELLGVFETVQAFLCLLHLLLSLFGDNLKLTKKVEFKKPASWSIFQRSFFVLLSMVPDSLMSKSTFSRFKISLLSSPLKRTIFFCSSACVFVAVTCLQTMAVSNPASCNNYASCYGSLCADKDSY